MWGYGRKIRNQMEYLPKPLLHIKVSIYLIYHDIYVKHKKYDTFVTKDCSFWLHIFTDVNFIWVHPIHL